MNILILNRDYPRFLTDMYAARPELTEASYADQLSARNATLFGVADFYSRGFTACGHRAQEIHVNNPWLQGAWARENGIKAGIAPPASRTAAAGSVVSRTRGAVRRLLLPIARRFLPRQIRSDEERVLAAQIEEVGPDVILNQEMSYVRTRCLERIAPKRIKIVGQIASALPLGERYGRYDLILSSLPNMVQYFRDKGARSELSRLAFDPRVLEQVETPARRDIEVSFVGSLSADHGGRIRLLETLADQVPLQVWGSGVDELPKSSPLRACHRGEAWGKDMYRVLCRSRITINQHIDLAEGYSNNMRLYEATGCGALMVVDLGRNLGDMFEPSKEVVSYSSSEECVEAVRRMLADEAARREIAAAGQRRTLSQHTYSRRTAELSDLFLNL